jgi:catechol-2,3-dioxygenase
VHVEALGHVVLKVRDLKRSEEFYSDTLGMRVVLRLSEPHMTFFSLEATKNHHDFALLELGFDAQSPDDHTAGLAHVAFKIGSSADALGLARDELRASGSPILYEAERGFAKSVHVLDPDGNEIELYVDTSCRAEIAPIRTETGTSQVVVASDVDRGGS